MKVFKIMMNKYCFLASILLFGISLQGQSLIGANVDDLSDAEILSIVERGKAQGFNIENGQEMVMSLGLSADEALKFKTRLEGIENSKFIELGNLNSKGKQDVIEVELPKKIISKKGLGEKSSNIYGHNYFNVDYESFDQSNLAKAPKNYILGPGDELTVSIFGSSYFQQTFNVSESGILNLGAKFGRLKIRGMVYSNVEKLVRARFSKGFNFSKNTFDLSLSYGRNISVNIIGEVNNPGTYSLNAWNNAFHALVVAGGPSELGSLRNVSVYRDGEVIEVIDFYQFFNNPKKSKIPFLKDGDFLMVPTISNLVSTGGEFNRIMTFEILRNETVSDLINFSSGFSANAYGKKIQVFRSNDDEKRIIDVELKDFSSLILNDGDSVFANVKKGKLENLVTISGALAQPGDYGYLEGMTLRDLINLAGGIVGRNTDKEISLSRLMPSGFYRIIRKSLSNEDALDMKLSILDNVFIGFKSLDTRQMVVSVFGAVKTPGQFIYSKGMTLEDAIKRSGGLELYSDNNRIEITRKKIIINEKGHQEILKISKVLSLDPLIKENWSDEYKKSGFLLEPFDEISVRAIKKYATIDNIFISGAIEFPGIYSILNPDEKISDIIGRAGGISPEAAINNAVFYRKQKGVVILDLENALEGGNSDYRLKDSDSLHVPLKEEIIGITGNGHLYFYEFGESTLNVPIFKSFRSYRYIKEFALGITKKVKRKDIYVSYPSGKVDRSKKVLLLWNLSPKVENGGIIHVNERSNKKKLIKEKKPLDWNQVVATVTSAAMGFGTVYALITRP